jgi:L-ectoine synthase
VIVRHLDQLAADRTVSGPTWSSRRLLLADDRVGFSLHDTILGAGTRTEMHYKHHVEAVYCIEGRGELHALATGEVHPIAPGTVYCLDAHDKHVLVAHEQLRMVCVFTPPIVGPETHGPDGAYPLLTLDAG